MPPVDAAPFAGAGFAAMALAAATAVGVADFDSVLAAETGGVFAGVAAAGFFTAAALFFGATFFFVVAFFFATFFFALFFLATFFLTAAVSAAGSFPALSSVLVVSSAIIIPLWHAFHVATIVTQSTIGSQKLSSKLVI
ncbi:MAG: hypothetical protein ABW096_00990 [Candidatus Thiodiazotropha sp.]